jgi:hypothetical protein
MPVTSKDGNNYVIVMIEHFTKCPAEKSSEYTAAALKRVLTTVFGAALPRS